MNRLTAQQEPQHRFQERMPWEVGFAKIYDSKIALKLEQIETERRKNRWLSVMRFLIHLPIITAGLYFGLKWMMEYFEFGFWAFLFWALTACLIFFISVVYAFIPILDHNEKWETFLIEVACEFYGGISFSRIADKPIDGKKFESLGLIPSLYLATVKCQDIVKGEVNGRPFRWMEVSTIEVTSQADGPLQADITFAGHFMTIEALPDFATNTEDADIRIESRAERQWRPKTMPEPKPDPVAIDNAEFSEGFRVLANSVAAARRLITPEFIANFLALSQRWGPNLQAAFHNGEFHLSVETDVDLFEEFDSSKKTADIEELMHTYLHDLHLVRQLAAILP